MQILYCPACAPYKRGIIMALNKTAPKTSYESLSLEIQSYLIQEEITQQEWEAKLSAKDQQSLIMRINTMITLPATTSSLSTKKAPPQQIMRDPETKVDRSVSIDDLPHELKQIVLDYLTVNEANNAIEVRENLNLLQELPYTEDEFANDIPKLTIASFYQKTLTFFENVTAAKAVEAAQEILLDNLVAVESLAIRNPSILFCVVKVKDHNGNILKGNLLRIAAMTGNFNPRVLNESEQDYGIFERLSRYYPASDVKDLCNEILSSGWIDETSRRMHPYAEAFNALLNSFVTAKKKTYAGLKIECQAAIEKFKNALKPDPDQVIQSGFVFDLQVMVNALTQAFDMVTQYAYAPRIGYGVMEMFILRDVDGLSPLKLDVICAEAFDHLKKKMSVCDARILRTKIKDVVDGNILPNRSLYCDFDNDSFITYKNHQVLNTLRVDNCRFVIWGCGTEIYRSGLEVSVSTDDCQHLKKLISNKNISAKELIQRIEKKQHSNCAIM